jgi:hypothetical protein
MRLLSTEALLGPSMQLWSTEVDGPPAFPYFRKGGCAHLDLHGIHGPLDGHLAERAVHLLLARQEDARREALEQRRGHEALVLYIPKTDNLINTFT